MDLTDFQSWLNEFWSSLTWSNLAEFLLASTPPNLNKFQSGTTWPNLGQGQLNKISVGINMTEFDRISSRADYRSNFDQGWLHWLRRSGSTRLNMAKFWSQSTQLNTTKFRSGLIRSITSKFGPRLTRPNFGRYQHEWILTRAELTKFGQISIMATRLISAKFWLWPTRSNMVKFILGQTKRNAVKFGSAST